MPNIDDLLPSQLLARAVRRLECSCGFDPDKYGDGSGGAFDFSRQAALLQIALEVAVPMWHAELEAMRAQFGTGEVGVGLFWDELKRRCDAACLVVAEKGDLLMFRGKRRGESAAAFNALASGVACLAYAPGGVTVLGTKWEFVRVDLLGGRGRW